MVQRTSLLMLMALTLVAAQANAASTGYVQIECDTTSEVYLDGTKVGATSSEQPSLIVEASAGRHYVEVRKSGFQTQGFSIVVEAAKVKQVRVAPFQRSIQVGESGEADEKPMEQKIGSFKLQTVPVECSIDVPQLKLANQAKSKADWFVKDIPVGVYAMSLTATVPITYTTKDPATGHDVQGVLTQYSPNWVYVGAEGSRVVRFGSPNALRKPHLRRFQLVRRGD